MNQPLPHAATSAPVTANVVPAQRSFVEHRTEILTAHIGRLQPFGLE